MTFADIRRSAVLLIKRMCHQYSATVCNAKFKNSVVVSMNICIETIVSNQRHV